MEKKFQRAAEGGNAVRIAVWNGLWRANGNRNFYFRK